MHVHGVHGVHQRINFNLIHAQRLVQCWVGSSFSQIRDALGFYTLKRSKYKEIINGFAKLTVKMVLKPLINYLKVNMSAFRFFFLPRHSNEGTLDIIVDNLSPSARPFLDLFLVRGITFNAQPYLL